MSPFNMNWTFWRVV